KKWRRGAARNGSGSLPEPPPHPPRLRVPGVVPQRLFRLPPRQGAVPPRQRQPRQVVMRRRRRRARVQRRPPVAPPLLVPPLPPPHQPPLQDRRPEAALPP